MCPVADEEGNQRSADAASQARCPHISNACLNTDFDTASTRRRNVICRVSSIHGQRRGTNPLPSHTYPQPPLTSQLAGRPRDSRNHNLPAPQNRAVGSDCTRGHLAATTPWHGVSPRFLPRSHIRRAHWKLAAGRLSRGPRHGVAYGVG